MQLKSILCALHPLILATSVLRSMQPLTSTIFTMCYFCSWKYHPHICTILCVVSILETCTYAAPTLGVRIPLFINHPHSTSTEKMFYSYTRRRHTKIFNVLFYLSSKAPVISIDAPYCYQCIKRVG